MLLIEESAEIFFSEGVKFNDKDIFLSLFKIALSAADNS